MLPERTGSEPTPKASRSLAQIAGQVKVCVELAPAKLSRDARNVAATKKPTATPEQSSDGLRAFQDRQRIIGEKHGLKNGVALGAACGGGRYFCPHCGGAILFSEGSWGHANVDEVLAVVR
jgi:hypothetical protein